MSFQSLIEAAPTDKPGWGGERGSSAGNSFTLRYSSHYLNLLVFEGDYLCIDLGWSLDD